MSKRTLLSLVSALIVTGCTSVPTNEISMPGPGGRNFTLKFPQNMSWTNVVFESRPDGTVSAKIGGVTSYNDATVVGIVATANAAMVHDTLNFAEGVIAKGAKGAVAP
jgi:hypothetical protein